MGESVYKEKFGLLKKNIKIKDENFEAEQEGVVVNDMAKAEVKEGGKLDGKEDEENNKKKNEEKTQKNECDKGTDEIIKGSCDDNDRKNKGKSEEKIMEGKEIIIEHFKDMTETEDINDHTTKSKGVVMNQIKTETKIEAKTPPKLDATTKDNKEGDKNEVERTPSNSKISKQKNRKNNIIIDGNLHENNINNLDALNVNPYDSNSMLTNNNQTSINSIAISNGNIPNIKSKVNKNNIKKLLSENQDIITLSNYLDIKTPNHKISLTSGEIKYLHTDVLHHLKNRHNNGGTNNLLQEMLRAIKAQGNNKRLRCVRYTNDNNYKKGKNNDIKNNIKNIKNSDNNTLNKLMQNKININSNINNNNKIYVKSNPNSKRHTFSNKKTPNNSNNICHCLNNNIFKGNTGTNFYIDHIKKVDNSNNMSTSNKQNGTTSANNNSKILSNKTTKSSKNKVNSHNFLTQRKDFFSPEEVRGRQRNNSNVRNLTNKNRYIMKYHNLAPFDFSSFPISILRNKTFNSPNKDNNLENKRENVISTITSNNNKDSKIRYNNRNLSPTTAHLITTSYRYNNKRNSENTRKYPSSNRILVTDNNKNYKKDLKLNSLFRPVYNFNMNYNKENNKSNNINRKLLYKQNNNNNNNNNNSKRKSKDTDIPFLKNKFKSKIKNLDNNLLLNNKKNSYYYRINTDENLKKQHKTSGNLASNNNNNNSSNIKKLNNNSNKNIIITFNILKPKIILDDSRKKGVLRKKINNFREHPVTESNNLLSTQKVKDKNSGKSNNKYSNCFSNIKKNKVK